MTISHQTHVDPEILERSFPWHTPQAGETPALPVEQLDLLGEPTNATNDMKAKVKNAKSNQKPVARSQKGKAGESRKPTEPALPVPPSDNGGAFVLAPVEELVPSKTNPRKYFDEAKLEELAESIRQLGVAQPLVVRKLAPGKYEIVAGERRWRAATRAKLKMVPVMLRVLTDDQVLEIQVVENLQRADVTPLEEAAGFRRMLDSGRYTADTLAEKLGKSRAYVFERLKLLKVCKAVRDDLEAGHISASVALEISRVPGEEAQEELLEMVDCDRLSVQEVKEEIERNFTRNLKKATWPLTDAELCAKAGSCAACPKRSGNMPEATGSPDICTDVECFASKLRAQSAKVLAKARSEGHPTMPPEKWERIRYHRNHSKLDEVVHSDPKKRTVRQLLEKVKDFKPIVTIEDGKRVELVECEQWRDLAREHKLLPAGTLKDEPGEDEGQEKEREEARAKAESKRQGLEKILMGALDNIKSTPAWVCQTLQFMASVIIENGYDEVHHACAARGIDLKKAGDIEEARHALEMWNVELVRKGDEHALRRLIVELQVRRRGFTTWNDEASEGFARFCEWTGLNLAAALAAAKIGVRMPAKKEAQEKE